MGEHKVIYAGCTEPGFDLLRYVNENLIPVNEILTLTPEQGERYNVAGYHSYASYADDHAIPIYTPESYKMTNETDIRHFTTEPADVMIVHGWQRLIPEEVLDNLRHGALGFHGSAYGLPQGRGRSPMNWSLIEDLDRFILSMMHLDEGVDSGGIVCSKKYDITEFDTIKTMYYKLVVAAQKMLDEVLLDGLENGFDHKPQQGEPTYYPKRNPDDGAINWEDPTRVIYNLVRALAKPYPGAFTRIEDKRIYIWDAHPFSSDFLYSEPPGTIVQVFTPDNDFVVNTSDGTLLVTEWEASDWEPRVGMRFESLQNESINSPNRFDRREHKDKLSGH